MTLKDCNKEELIHIVNYIAGRIGLNQKDYYIQSALADVKYRRDKKKLDKAEELNQLSTKNRNEYINLMKSYAGMKYSDVPYDVLSKASALIREAEKADMEYNKIMKEV